jgi:DNA-binding transcriptional MerR regulator
MNQYHPIYKVNHLVDGNIQKIFVFYGKKVTEKDSSSLYPELFSPKEIEMIQTKNISVQILEQTIHYDDSIGVIKLKILNEFKNTDFLEEMYLFCDQIERINTASLYSLLTQNKRIELTNVRLKQFLSNIVSSEKSEKLVYPPSKDVYDYDDLLSLKFDNTSWIVHKVLGQKFFIVENEYPFAINPYDLENIDPFFEKTARKSLSTLNGHLLLTTGEIVNNTINVCFAKNVLRFLSSKNKNMSEENIINIYYPFLYSQNIFSFKELQESESSLIEKNTSLLTDKTIENFNTVSMFYDVYNTRKKDLSYLSKGIKSIKAIMKPVNPIFIPLEIIYKLIHATKQNPLIKYNPSTRQENSYRLYTEKVAMDGRRIPFLKKGIIFKLIRTIGKSKSVTVYIEYYKEKEKEKEKEKKENTGDKEPLLQIICEFNENGFITISSEFDSVMDENEIDEIFKESVNPIIQEINDSLQQSGYKIDLFHRLNDARIEIHQLTYETQIKISKKIDLKTYQGCISSIFNNETSQFKKDLQLRFKRVSNFNKFTSQEAFILEKRDDGYRGHEIVQSLLENFKEDLTKKQAEEMVKKIVNEVELERGVRKSDIRIKNNPGFKTLLHIDQASSSIKITVENINDIRYLRTIPIYLDTLIRFTQDKKSSGYSWKKIDTLCSSGEKEDVKLPDILPSHESPLPDWEAPILDDENESVEYSKLSGDVNEDDEQKNAFDLFFGNDDEEEEEEEETVGGNGEESPSSFEDDYNNNNNNNNNIIQNIDGMTLRNYFQNEIEKKDKALIIKQPVGNFSIYSKVCQSSAKRQPVIITDEQLDTIKKEHPGFLRDEDVIRYGSNKEKPFNYVCPRYWCLKTNTLIDPKEMKEVKENGKTELVHPTCGKILDENADVIEPGHYVYEFYKPPKTKPDYKRYPNFQVDKHPDGFCLPCCFDKWKTDARITAKNKCYGIEEEKKEEKKGKEIEDEYVKGPDKFPLAAGRWGYLPSAIQTMLHEVNAECQISKTNTNLKSNHPCLLRHGVEINEKQSFIACISDAIFFAKKITSSSSEKFTKVLSIQEMRKRIIQSLSIDQFILFQNGNLTTDFYDKNRKIDIQKYVSSNLYMKLDSSKETDLLFFQKVVSAFENFIQFLEDDDAIINHVYLWDIISKPNKYIFPSGINLIILEIPNNDITNNVHILCPTNHYSSEFYEARKPTLLLLKEENFYEPIYSLTITGEKNSITKIFSEYDPHLSKSMKMVFQEIIKPLYKTLCKPLDSMPTIYSAKRPILLYDLMEKLDKYKYTVKKQVINFKNKVIGLIAQSSSLKTGFIPCYPSAIYENAKENIDYVLMTDDSLWKTYEETFSFLTELYKKTNKKKGFSGIPCKPIFKIIEDELVVGLLTETNQFVQISQPISEMEIKKEQQLPSFKNTNYIIQPKSKPMIQSESIISTTDDVDKDRVDYILKIKLETKFYNVFRNTIRILLNHYENVKTREKIETFLSKEYFIYNEKLKKINELLRELVKDQIQFIGDDHYYKLLNQVSTCIIKEKDKCENESYLCSYSKDGKCKLILPEKNLITKKRNEPIYYNKMADEFIRYLSIRNFMFQPQNFLSFTNIEYDLREDEIILLQSLLTQEYFETLTQNITNPYVNYRSYDEADPILTQSYDNIVKSLEPIRNSINENDCLTIKKTKITSQIWSEIFPPSYNEIRYDKHIACTYQIMIDLLKLSTNKISTINQIKKDLFEIYKTLMKTYHQDKIMDILILEGKKSFGDQVKSGSLSFEDFIYGEQYYLTPFDLWLLLQKYQIPSFFISQQFLFQTNYKKHAFLTYGDFNNNDTSFVFIVIPGLKPQQIPGYKYIENDQNEAFISIDFLLNESKGETMIQEAFRNKITIENYLTQFVKPSTTKYIKKKPLIILESDD